MNQDKENKMEEIKKKAQALVEEKKLQEAITYLQESIPQHNSVETILLSLENQLININQDQVKGIISNADYKVTINRIKYALVDIIDQLDKSAVPPSTLGAAQNKQAANSSSKIEGIKNTAWELIKEREFKQTFVYLLANVPEQNQAYQLLSSLDDQYERVNRNWKFGLMTMTDYQLQSNQIKSSLRNTVENLEDSKNDPIKANPKSGSNQIRLNTALLISLLLALILITLIYIAFK